MANQIKYKVGFDVDSKALKSLQNELIQLQKMTSKDFMKINPGTSLSQAKKELQQIKKTAKQVDDALDNAFSPKLNSLNLGEFKKQLNGLNINKIYNDFSKMGATGQAAFRNLSGQMMTVNTRIRESHSLLDKMATTLGNTLKWNVASSAINGMTRSIDQAWGYVKSLDGSLNDIRIVTGKSSDEMARFAVQANNAAKQLGKTTTDYTKASLIYAQQGLSDEEIEARARITLKAANVTGQSTDAVSEELTAVWNGYKVTAEEAEVYVDRLAAIAAHTASNLEELSTGMSKVASAAAAMGVGEDQLAAQLSTIISVTRQAPESVGTALRTVYARISDIKAGIDEDGVTLGNYSGKMQALGFSVLDAAGNLRDMGEVMEEIGNKWQFLTREQQVNLAQTMAGQRQYSNLIALFDNFSEYNRALGIAQNATGTLQQQQDIYMESTVAHLNQLKASVEDVYDSFMNRDSLDSVNDLIDALSNGATIIARFVDSLGGGMNILSSLGALGITVFSKQIAGSIQTTINNLNRGRQQAQAFKDALANAAVLNQSGQGNEYTKYLNSKQEQLLAIGNRLPKEDFDIIQKNFNDLRIASSTVDTLNQKIDSLENNLQELGFIFNEDIQEFNTLDQALASADGIQVIKNDLNNFKNALTPSVESFKELQRQVQKLNSTKIDTNTWAAYKQTIRSANAAMHQMFTTLQQSTFNGKSILNFFPESTLQSIEKAKAAISGFNWNMNKAQAQANAKAIEQVFTQLKTALYNRIREIRLAMDSLNEQSPQNLEKLKEELVATTALVKQLQTNIDTLSANAASRIQIQNFVNLAGGIAQVGSSIQQLQNLGSIWFNDDIGIGQKLLQTITNLSFSLPMLISGWWKAGTAIGFFNTSMEAAQIAALKGTAGINLAHLSIRRVTTSAEKGAIAIQLFDKAFLLTGVGAFVIGVTAAATAVLILVKAFQAYNKHKIEADKKIIEEQNQIQQEINKNQELYDSIEKLNNQYKNNEITRTELRSEIQNLIDQYDVESSQVQRLTEDYENLTETLKTLREQQAQEAIVSNLKEQKKEEDIILRSARQGRGHGVIGADYNITFANDASIDLGRRLKDANIQGTITQNSSIDPVSLTMIYDINNIIQLYDELIEVRSELVKSGQTETDEYKQIDAWISKLTEDINKYKITVQDINKNATFLQGITKDFDNIKNLSQYHEQRQAFFEAVKNNQNIRGTDADKNNLVDTYLQKYYGDLYDQYAEADKRLDEYKDKFGEIPQDIQNSLKNLDDQQLLKALSLSPEFLTGWDQFRNIIRDIDSYELSNVANLGDFEARYKDNVDNLRKYQDISETVSSGKQVKEDDFKTLTPELQKFFSYAGDGMYKMVGDAKEFYNAINNAKVEDLVQTAAALNNEIEKNKQLAEKNFNYENLTQDAYSAPNLLQGRLVGSFDKDLINQQLDYLDTVIPDSDVFQSTIDKWKQMNEEGKITKEIAEQIRAKIQEVGNQTTDLEQKNEKAKQQYEDLYRLFHDAMFPIDEDIDQKQLQKLTDNIQDLAKGSKELANVLQEDDYAAQDVAESLLRFSDATKDVADNYDDWMKALSSGSLGDQLEAIDGLRDAYADLLDFPEDAFSDQFLTSADNLNLLKEAANGSTEAYDQLMQAAQQDIATQVGLDTTAFDNAFNSLMDQYYQGQNLDDMQIGASLNNEGFLQGLTDMVNAAGMTAQQATAYLASMGVDAQVVEQDTEAEEASETMDYKTHITQTQHHANDRVLTKAGMSMTPVDVTQDITTWDQQIEAIPKQGKTKKQNKSFALKVTSAHKSSGGGFKYSNAPGKKSYSGGKGSGGGGGGGGGGGSKPDTSKKDSKKPVKTQKDPYHDINIQLQKINRQLERIQDKQERLYGKQLIDNLNKQNQLLEQQKNKLKQKSEIQKKDLENQRKTLKQMGAIFDKQGNLTNYSDLISQRQAEIQAMYNQYNKNIQKYNNSTNADYKKALSQSLSQYDKQIKEKEDSLKELTSAISKYDKTREQFEDNLDKIEEATQKQIEINIKKFNMQLEIRLDMGKAERDWNKFKRNVLEKTDVLKDSNFDKIFGDTKQSFDDLFSYFNVHGSVGSIEALTNQLNATKQQIEQIDATGTSAIYGDNKAQAMEDLQKNLDELMDQMQDMEGLIDKIDQAYLDTIDDIQEGFDEQIESYEYVQDLLKSDLDLLQLLYGDKNYDAMNSYYEQLQQNNNKQLDSLRRQREFWKEQWDEAVAKGDTNAAKKFEQNYKNTISNLNQLIQDSVENLQNKYSNAVEQIFDALDKKLTNGKGSDYLQESWDLMTKNADQYLDAVNSAFAIQSTQRKYQNALNETKSIKNQQALKDLMDQQLKILKNKDKLTQYDVDRAQKLLEVEQARIALEDARSAKTSMRLKRDSQGNYSYEYMADEEGINEAEQNYANAQNDLYNFDREKTNQTTGEILAAWQEFKDKYKEIMLDVSLSDEERHERLKLLQDQWGQYFNLKTEQLIGARENLMESAFENFASLYGLDVQNYQDMADAEKEILMSDIVPTWDNGIVAMATKMAGEGGLLPVCKEAFLDLDTTTDNYKKDLEALAIAAGINLNDIKTGVDNNIFAFSELIQSNDELIQKMSNEIQAIRLLKMAADELKQEYKETTEAAKDMVTQIHNFIQAQQAQAADYIANQQAMASAYADARAKEADAYVAAVNRIVAAITAANNGSTSGGSSPGGSSPGGSNPSGTKSTTTHGTLSHWEERQFGGGYATGGYTGDWNSDEGRVAMLHEKELVLNKEDTKNILDAVQIIRALNDSVLGKAYDINSGLSLNNNSQNNQQTLEQNVHITASFPNVDSKKQIKEAFSELTNLAAQRIMRK